MVARHDGPQRDAVLDAVLDLFAEDALAPSAIQVAERSGVSLRSVYRYFDDTDELVRAAIERNLVRVRPLFVIDGLGEGSLEDRTRRIVDSRLELHERVGPLMRATLLHAGEHELLAARLATVRRLLREQTEDMFAPELGAMGVGPRREVAAAVDLLLGFESIEQLRKVRGLSLPATARVVVRAVQAVVESA
jgi:AcrR family transcriptional regulator